MSFHELIGGGGGNCDQNTNFQLEPTLDKRVEGSMKKGSSEETPYLNVYILLNKVILIKIDLKSFPILQFVLEVHKG